MQDLRDAAPHARLRDGGDQWLEKVRFDRGIVVEQEDVVGARLERRPHPDVDATGEPAILGEPHDADVREALGDGSAGVVRGVVVYDDDGQRRVVAR